MPRYLYIFAFQTPEQLQSADPGNFAEESSAAVFIDAESAEKALEWGRKISEAFVSSLSTGPQPLWSPDRFDNWIEAQPQSEYPPDILTQLPAVAYGVLPDFSILKR